MVVVVAAVIVAAAVVVVIDVVVIVIVLVIIIVVVVVVTIVNSRRRRRRRRFVVVVFMLYGVWMLQMEQKRPLVYSSLQLGRSWDDVVCNLLGDVQVQTTVTRSLPVFGLPVMAVA